MNRAATSVTITDPFIKYTSLIATGIYRPDASQYRLAHHLQKLYLRLKDYTPATEYRARLQQIAKIVELTKTDHGRELASATHPIRRNPLFARFFQTNEYRGSLALTRILTSHQAALHVNSPQGLFLSGEVGTGKSMLIDLLAEGLPTNKKRRWHYNTFMLYAFSRLEEFRKSRPNEDHAEYSLLWLAKEMMEQSPILFLDEFQLPDRAASKIMNNLFIAFFQLGGVLIASSNRMPEELEKATGGYYSPPPTGGLVERVLGLSKRRYGELFGQTSDFAAFLEVLKARCDFWHMEGTRDWRRRETQIDDSGGTPEPLNISGISDSLPVHDAEMIPEQAKDGIQQPFMYFLSSKDEERWKEINSQLGDWGPSFLIVYGRKVSVPRQRGGVTYWNFEELVSSFGSADYITLASNYHTFIVDKVPVLTLATKNEARRFITLLDALYESKCKLIIRAEAGPDDLFFPEMRRRPSSAEDTASSSTTGEVTDATYSETIAEVYQNQVAPFRPNISTYGDAAPNSKYDPDQDSDFGKEQDVKVDFSKTGAFTGEDERFAYKRATITLILGSCLVLYCLKFTLRTPSPSKPALTPELLNNLSLDEHQCNAAFPGLTKEIDDVVAQGPFIVKQIGDLGPLQGRIKNGQSRTASLHQLHRAILTSPSPVPNTTFSLNFQDQPFGTAFTYSRSSTRAFSPTYRPFLVPHFSFWAWDLPFIGSMSRAASAISLLESSFLSFSQKIPKAVWRGTPWYNSVQSPQLRQNLLAKTKNQPWADVQKLEWGNDGTAANATNAIPIQDFCKYKYIIHTEGVTYSGRFQYHQMCKSVLITPPLQWMQHLTHMVKPLFSSTLDLGTDTKKWEPIKAINLAWPRRYKPEEANIVFVSKDWSDLGATVQWLESHPEIAEGIASRQRELFVDGGYFSPAAETCYWRALIKGWASVAQTDGWEEAKGIPFETFILKNTK
ncbi:lactation elevated protein 1 [Podospora fimiseda]|uniref:Lactation elevated protein 1 n=1 Tax=Podospora fimiseda TaxID=252190 RepID=A0AAN7BUP9_9PEZI|nr:lactation elevated protein 1 [Podospora fimiseda]